MIGNSFKKSSLPCDYTGSYYLKINIFIFHPADLMKRNILKLIPEVSNLEHVQVQN